MPKNGVVGEISFNTRKAADGRHPPFVATFMLPETHIAWPEGTIMVQDAGVGKAAADTSGEGVDVIGVLDEAVEANEGAGNVMLHGSCPADILKWVDGGEIADASAAQIEALRGIGIYV